MRRPLYALGVAVSVALCVAVAWPWAYPRETFSGLVGRWLVTEGGWKLRLARLVAPWIDCGVHLPLGVETCVELYDIERRARAVVYGMEYETGPELPCAGTLDGEHQYDEDDPDFADECGACGERRQRC